MAGDCSSKTAGRSFDSPGPNRKSGSSRSPEKRPEQRRYIPRFYRAQKAPLHEGRRPRSRRGHADEAPHGQSSEAPSPGGRQAVSAAHSGGPRRGQSPGDCDPHRMARPSDPRAVRGRQGPRPLARVRRASGATGDGPRDRVHAQACRRDVPERQRGCGRIGPGAVRASRVHQKVRGPVMALAEVPNPRAFGVVEMKDGKVAALEEKPREPKSNLINAGIYGFDEDLFPLIDATPKSPRGEYEITDTIRLLMAKRDVSGFRLPGEWIDVGRPWDLLRANTALLTPLKGANRGHLDPGATLVGEVLVEEVKVGVNAYVDAGTIIGEEADLGTGAQARGDIEARSRNF